MENEFIKGDSFKQNYSSMGKFGALILDPPWKIWPEVLNHEWPITDDVIAFCSPKYLGLIMEKMWLPYRQLFVWDCQSSFWVSNTTPLLRTKLAIWFGNSDYKESFYRNTASSVIEVRNTGRTRHGAYQYKSDPRGRRLCDLYQHPLSKLNYKKDFTFSKPIWWVTSILESCTNGRLLDPFAGEGMTDRAARIIDRDSLCIDKVERNFGHEQNINIDGKEQLSLFGD